MQMLDLQGGKPIVGLIHFFDRCPRHLALPKPGNMRQLLDLASLIACDPFDHYEAITSSPYLAMPSDILSCPGQVTNYTNLAGLGGGTNVSRMMLPLAQGYDIGVNPAAASFNGIPWRQINGMTTTETYWPNLADYTMGVQRDVTYEPYGKTNDDTTGQVTMAVMAVIERRRSHSKQESLTA